MGGTLCTPQRRHFHLSSRLLGAEIGLLRMIPSSELSIPVKLSSSSFAAIIGIRAACKKKINLSLQVFQFLRHLGQW